MNDVITQKFKSYGAKTAEQEADALREIIQEVALLGLWRAKFFEHAAFYGGTALRILYGLDRFSEDIDFTFIKADTTIHLIKVGSPSRTQKGAVLKVKFEVDVQPAPGFTTEVQQFFWPQPFSVLTCDLPSLFAGKLHAVFCRERVRNVKGRDFYAFLWYVGRKVRPNYDYLKEKLIQSGHWPAEKEFTPDAFKSWAKERLRSLDIEAAKRDVERFLPNPRVLDGWTRDVFMTALERIDR